MNLIQSMEYRMPWTIARAIFKNCEIPVGRGWDDTWERLRFIHDEESYANNISRCTDLYEGHIKHGEKNVKFYSVTDEQLRRIHDAIGNIQLSEGLFSDAYPFVVDEDDLPQIASDVHYLVQMEDSAEGVYLIFASKRFVEQREVIVDADILEGVRGVVGIVNELITVTRGPRQLFDVVFLPHTGQHIQLCVDHPRDMPAEYAVAAQRKLRDTFFSLARIGDALEPVNLFPLIRLMYDNGNEGSVVEMDFSTNTASVKRERMRRGAADLRTELYHRAGYAAIAGNIDPYKIAIRWPVDEANMNPELLLNSSLRMLHSQSPFLYDAEIRHCVTSVDYFHVINRMFGYFEQ